MTRVAPDCQPDRRLIDRISDRDAFLRLRHAGRRVRSSPMWCSYVHDPDVFPAQVAFAIGRPIGNAVTRNLLRRRLRSLLASVELPPGLYLFGGQPASGELTFAQLRIRVDALVDAVRCQLVTP